LPEPGRGGKIEAKIIVGEGAGHGIWKMIEGERERWLERKREENTLRESLFHLHLGFYHEKGADGSYLFRWIETGREEVAVIEIY
jgi:hypothetical protein